MKTTTLLAMIAAMGVTACSKSSNSSNSNTSSNYYVKATIDGINVSYTNYTGALNQNYTVGYFNTNEANLFLQQSGSQFISNGVMNATNSTPFTCTITAINNQSISGTFSGTVYFGTAVKKVTNGSFHVAF